MALSEGSLQLPVSIISPTDIARLLREIESIDDFFRQSKIRGGGSSSVDSMPQASKLMSQLSNDNQLNLLQETDRDRVVGTLKSLQDSAPVLHISFSVDPPGSHVQKIVAWLRSNIDEHTLVTVGLQPNIGAGCVVRTTNKLFDFSLREFFASKRQFFIEKMHQSLADPDLLEAERKMKEAAEAQPTQPMSEAPA